MDREALERVLQHVGRAQPLLVIVGVAVRVAALCGDLLPLDVIGHLDGAQVVGPSGQGTVPPSRLGCWWKFNSVFSI